MTSDLISTSNLSFLLVFLEGLLSFFSPCVIPLIPVYMSYLAGNAKRTDSEGNITYERTKVFFHTLFFVAGISTAFFTLGLSFTALGNFFQNNRTLFTRIGGIIIILLGLVQIGLLDFDFLKKEKKIHLKLSEKRMNPLVAFLMGFTFSFAWTPCVGPALSSVLIMASGSSSSFVGNLLVLVYTLGFIIPFLLLGLFTTQALNFLKKHRTFLKYTVKAGGLLLILIGIMTFTGWMNSVSSYLNRFTPQLSQDSKDSIIEKDDVIVGPPEETPSEEKSNVEADGKIPSDTDSNTATVSPEQKEENTNAKQIIPAFDFTLTDQYGEEHTLSDYQGKVVFLNFWATWCPPCKKEMPDIEELYKEYGYNQEDIIILGVANPASDEYPNNGDVKKEEIISFLEDNGYTFPVVFDETGDVLRDYYISAFPTTFMIDKNGNIYGYVPGMMTKDMMNNVIQQTIEAAE
ncbi:redoxin domain-containing protein [Lachnospiraceae bacterium MD1]|uniref:Redoxin domain-containing protein n=1 Tax=Variimorphobacter saccharofermentans TaxID=2755051 RepID=A0A839K3A3_9FIRM|nr:cytochrome c biogenesis protein/redoxin [Variimorphobacter saccharofermentans]MBB2184385.1 redoxin domain-containing protein [Variimorphobacter saccharofermentans]